MNMSSPSLPMVPQWLKLAFCVKRALGILLAFEKMEAGPIWGQVTFPFSALLAERIWPANETMSHDRASAICMCM